MFWSNKYCLGLEVVIGPQFEPSMTKDSFNHIESQENKLGLESHIQIHHSPECLGGYDISINKNQDPKAMVCKSITPQDVWQYPETLLFATTEKVGVLLASSWQKLGMLLNPYHAENSPTTNTHPTKMAAVLRLRNLL